MRDLARMESLEQEGENVPAGRVSGDARSLLALPSCIPQQL